MKLHPFGAEATRIGRRIGGNATVAICEPSFAGEALDAAIAMRRRGERFVASIVWEDERTRLAREHSLQYCAQYESWDEIRLMLNNFVDTLEPDVRYPLSVGDREALREFIRLSSGVVVRSRAEAARIEDALGTLSREVDVLVNDAPPIDMPPSALQPSDVVVYAPHERGDALGAYVTALGDLNLPVTIVARDVPRLVPPVRFVPASEAGAALARARVIVDATTNDPGVARVLAALGRPLVVCARGGAAEVLHGVVPCDPWMRSSILTAVADALGAEPPRARRHQPRTKPRTSPSIDRFGPAPPLVSVIVTTYNRPVILGDTLAAIERQTYPALEIIVVNDAGSPVDGIVARFPRARLIDQPVNRGPAAARNAGLRDARGEYVMFFDDDDEMFPEHVGALAGALSRSGLDVAYGQMTNGIVVTEPDGHYALRGIIAHNAVLDHCEIQWGGSLATTAVMFRRRLIDEIGFVDELLPANEDYEFWLRLATGREWVRVPDVTSLYAVRSDGSNRSRQNTRARYFAAHGAIFARHASGRPLVNAGRAAMLQLFGQPP